MKPNQFYRFGLMLGIENLRRNGFRLGRKKTLGKILQPINSYTRFPEYEFMGRHLEAYLAKRPEQELHILDVSSPKLFGLSLAYHYDVDVHLTDVDVASVEEAEILWDAVRHQAKGRAHFSVEDARALPAPAELYDVVFAMSVIEHVANLGHVRGDVAAMREMQRVLKPGGLLLITTPLGPRYVEQQRIGLEGAARETADRTPHFFQRIYTPDELPLPSPALLLEAATVGRRDNGLAKLYRRTGSNFRALGGFLNPALSILFNKVNPGFALPGGTYGEMWSESDVYGDVMLALEKRSYWP